MNKRQITKDEILQSIKKIAEKKERNWLSKNEFLKETGITHKQLWKHFYKWNEAVVQAGLQALDQRGRPDRKSFTKEELLKKIIAVARKLKRDYLAESEFTNETGISWRPIHRLFGSWEEAVKEAGLNIHPAHNIKIPDAKLFEEYFRVKNELNRFPTYPEFSRLSKYSIGVYENRFGNFTKFRKHALQYGIEKGMIKQEIAIATIGNLKIKEINKISYKNYEDRPVLGEKIDFKGLIHAPVNELGVVYLFGILCEDLGVAVESIQADFPDCEAKRKLKNNRWQRVRIEFEYKSSSFMEHGHDITKCDIIVCWEHDWKDCPLEVISLKEKLLKNNNPK